MNSIKYLLRTVIESRKSENVIYVIKALPLYHFFSEDLKPYEPFHTSLKAIKWGDPLLGMSSIRSCMNDKPG